VLYYSLERNWWGPKKYALHKIFVHLWLAVVNVSVENREIGVKPHLFILQFPKVLEREASCPSCTVTKCRLKRCVSVSALTLDAT